jgi:hypothetical protein
LFRYFVEPTSAFGILAVLAMKICKCPGWREMRQTGTEKKRRLIAGVHVTIDTSSKSPGFAGPFDTHNISIT